jgi:hypothetical protein
MPASFKKSATGTDGVDMTDFVVDKPFDSLLLDGEMPRLGTARPTVWERPTLALSTDVAPAADGSSLTGLTLPTLPTASLPTLPTQEAPAPVRSSAATDLNSASTDTTTTAAPTQPGRHPMAHLMPEKSAPNEASRRAAEARAAKKAKAKKVKLAVAAGFLVVAAVVGPPLFKWVGNALAEAGSTKTEQPAAPAAPADAAPGVGAATDAAKAAVTATNEQATPTP